MLPPIGLRPFLICGNSYCYPPISCFSDKILFSRGVQQNRTYKIHRTYYLWGQSPPHRWLSRNFPQAYTIPAKRPLLVAAMQRQGFRCVFEYIPPPATSSKNSGADFFNAVQWIRACAGPENARPPHRSRPGWQPRRRPPKPRCRASGRPDRIQRRRSRWRNR